MLSPRRTVFKRANISIGTIVSENVRYITVTRGSDRWRFRTVLSRETQIETSRPLANTSKMFIRTAQRKAVTKLRIAKVTQVTNEAAPFPPRALFYGQIGPIRLERQAVSPKAEV